MTIHRNHRQVTATWLCRWYTFPDTDPTTETNILVPSFLFGGSFHIEGEPVDEPQLSRDYPRLSRVTATMSKALYTVMIRIQQGEDVTGVDPSLWALVEGSATDMETGRVLEAGEVFPLI